MPFDLINEMIPLGIVTKKALDAQTLVTLYRQDAIIFANQIVWKQKPEKANTFGSSHFMKTLV